MFSYRVTLSLYGGHKIVHDYVQATDDNHARYQAFKYAIPLYKKARPEFLGLELFRKLKKVGNQWT